VELTLSSKHGEIVIADESPDTPRFDPRSADNACGPVDESFFGDREYRASSRHRIVVTRGDSVLASRILLATGGATGVHDHSALLLDNRCIVAVGPFICSLALPSLQVHWHTRTDQATCFGVYDSPGYASIISHGELEIARLTYSGRVLWSAGGADIFSEGFELHEHYAEAVDFYGTRYRFELETGHSKIIAA